MALACVRAGTGRSLTKPYQVFWSPGVNEPRYWVLSQIFHVDAEAAMCADADAEELGLFPLWAALDYRERPYQTVKWYRHRLCCGKNRTFEL